MSNPKPMAPLVGGEIEERIAAHLQNIDKNDRILRRAAATPLPGPMAEAFALDQDIVVGQYRVRAFVDIDFEFLAALHHPLDAMFKDVMEGRVDAEGLPPSQMLPTGAAAWQAYWIMTRSVDEVEEMLSKPGGDKELTAAAKKEFGRYQTKHLVQLYKAVLEQINRSNSTIVAYGADGDYGEGAERPPQPPRQQPTG